MKVLLINMLMWCAPFFGIFEQGEFTPCQPNVSRFIYKIVSTCAIQHFAYPQGRFAYNKIYDTNLENHK